MKRGCSLEKALFFRANEPLSGRRARDTPARFPVALRLFGAQDLMQDNQGRWGYQYIRNQSTVDTSPQRTPHYYGQYFLSLGKALTFSLQSTRFNTDTR